MAKSRAGCVGAVALLGLVCCSCEFVEEVQQKRIVALALEGGGFRAQSVATGFVAGVAANVPTKAGIQKTFVNTKILDRFSILSSNSGGSWFASSLIYSSKYLRLVEDMINSPSTSGAQFMQAYIDPWLKASGVDSSKFNLAKDIAEYVVKHILGTADEDTIFLLAYFLATGVDWNRFVDKLLLSTASINQTLMLGEEAVMEWAKGKTWLVAHTAVIPSQGKKGILYSNSDGSCQLTYMDNSTQSELTYMLPAKFSVKLGSGIHSSAPVTYLPTASYVKAHKLKYTATSLYHAESDALGVDGAHGNIAKFSGLLPVARVTAASSAFLGGAAILGDLVGDLESTIGNADFAPWISTAPDGLAFEVANTLIKQLEYNESHRWIGIPNKSVDDFAKAAVHGVIDGGYSDNTGIANAVASGVGEVVVILNSNATGITSLPDVLALFPGGANGSEFQPKVLYPVFESPTSADLQSQINSFHNLDLGGSEFLRFISVGTVIATTADNFYFGIQGSRAVTLHIINIGSALSIGLFENFANYATVIQEIVSVMLAKENAGFVLDTIMPIFLGSANAREIEVVV